MKLYLAAAATALLAIGCGYDPQTIIVVDDDDGATSSVVSGSGGSGGVGGASTSSTASQGGSGGAGGDLVGGGGSGGQGGSEPMCPAPSCAAGPNVINCDPGCGALHAGCAATCDESGVQPLHALGFGTWTIQVPPVAEQHPDCAQHCETDEAWWSVRFLLPDEAGCVTSFAAPENAIMFASCSASQLGIPSLCSVGGSPTCAEFHMNTCSSPATSGILLAVKPPETQLPDGGAIFTFTISQSSCSGPAPDCDLGCNGEG